MTKENPKFGVRRGLANLHFYREQVVVSVAMMDFVMLVNVVLGYLGY